MSNDALLEAVTRYTDAQPGDGPYLTPVKGVMILRSNREKQPSHLIFKPALCIVVQGTKWTIFGNQRFHYHAGQALVVSVEMPAVGRVVEFDLAVMRDVFEGLATTEGAIHPEAGANGESAHGVFVTDFDGPLADCALRLMRLIGTPQAIPMLYPSIMREICYWLLTGPRAADVAAIVLGSSHAHRVISVIHSLRNRFAEAVRIKELALQAQMSPSSFHRQFKTLTSMTPLQYQKQLRLLEARRLMLTDAANAETAAFQVGYESASQFSREYARMFGAPPRRDVVTLRAAAG